MRGLTGERELVGGLRFEDSRYWPQSLSEYYNKT